MAARRMLVAAAAASVAALALTAGTAQAAAASRDRPAAGDAAKPLTSDFGTPVGDNVNTLSVGPRGPQLVQDTRAFEKLARFNRTFRCLPGGVERRGGRGGGQAWLGVALRWLGCRKPV